jgi:hypothetical protein
MKTRPNSRNEGANELRSRILAHFRRERDKTETTIEYNLLTKVIAFIKGTTKRANARRGGLGRR